MLFRDRNIDDIECDESILVFLQSKEVDSINFKNAIIQLQQRPFELLEFEKELDKMIIEEEYGNEYFGDLIIENYPNLQSIVVKEGSLRNINSLKICNCEQLKTIEIEEKDIRKEDGELMNKGTFYYVKTVIIESIYKMNFNK